MSISDAISNDGQDNRVKPVYGVVTGVVTNNKDPEGLGRVQVKINVFEDKHVTGWAPVATLMAGTERGSFFLPEVEDEVLVAFEHGNINAPYVVGALWNGKHKPPETNSDGKNNIRKFRSRSGHEIVFNDDSENKKERLEIHTKAGHRIVLDDASGKEKVEIKDKSGNEIVMKTPDNSITIKCSGKVTISAQKEVMVDAQAIKLGGTGGKTLVTDVFIDLFNTHTHTGNQGAPTSPPTVTSQMKVHSTSITKGA